MKTIGCLNMSEKDGGQSSVTVGYFYLSSPFLHTYASDYLRTERLFLQRPIPSQMVSSFFSHFAALLLGIRNIAFLKDGKGKPSTSGRACRPDPMSSTDQAVSTAVVNEGSLSMDWLFFLLGAVAVVGINCFFWSSGREDLVSPFNFLLVLVCFLGLAICFLMHGSGSETHSKKNSIESSCKFPPEQKCPHALFFVSRDYTAGNQFQIAKQENEL